MTTQTFPRDSVRVPRTSTQAELFTTKNAKYDGRDVVVAILDTGTDPGAPGLNATCPDGRPKVIDVIDATGSGDVNCSTVREKATLDEASPLPGQLTSEGVPGKLTIEGKSGRTLFLNATWENPSGSWHVGAKRLFDILPGGLQRRIKGERRKLLDEAQRACLARVRKAAADFDALHPVSNALNEADKATKRELEAQLAQLEKAEKEFDDRGPVLDVVVWHDGEAWRAVVGSADDGDVSNLEPMTNFRAERQVGTFAGANLDPQGTLMNYTVNIFDEGSICSIVTDSGAHGTHVAGIVGAYHADKPEFNGVAPGAQIVAVKIGDSRLDGMETASALVRALRTVLDNGCDLINLSFGEAASPPNCGRFMTQAAEIVNKHGVIFVSSAGNSGPAYTTVGAPGGTCEEIISCGAYVTPAMMEAEYSMLEKTPSTMTTWSSRGPAQDGSQGVQLTAPGAAITSVPTWTLQRGQLMNGTSMSSPNLTGCIALVLSALKAEGLAFTPARVRHALLNTAKALPGADRSEVGCGIVQVDACFEFLTARAGIWTDDITYTLNVSTPGFGMGAPKKGIYLREPHETTSPRQMSVSVVPKMKEGSKNQLKVDFEKHVLLVSTADWVKVPNFLTLMATGRAFNVAIDPTALPEGSMHHAEILGYDEGEDGDSGGPPLFRVPIAVVKPTRIPYPPTPPTHAFADMEMTPGSIHRHFVACPPGATWAEATIKMGSYSGSGGSRRMLYLHALSLTPHTPFSLTEHKPRWFADEGSTTKHKFRVYENSTLELTLAQFWSSLGNGIAQLEITFGGVTPSTNDIVLDGMESISRVDLRAALCSSTVKPHGSLSVHRRLLRPKSAEGTIRPLGERDLFPEERRIHELQQQYELDMAEPSTITLRALTLQDRLYESPMESQLMLVYDSNKMLLGASDAWPEEIKLGKGKHTVVLQIRHDEPGLLKQFLNMPLAVDTDLDKPVALSAYSNFTAALSEGSKVPGATRLALGETMPVYFRVDNNAVADLKNIKPGDTLLGGVGYEASAPTEPFIQGKSSGARYTVPPSKAAAAKAPEPKDSRTDEEKNSDAVRDLRLGQLGKMRGKETKEAHAALFVELYSAYPGHLPLLDEALTRAVADAEKEENKDEKHALLSTIIEAAKDVVSAVDQDAVITALSKRLPDDASDEAKKLREEEEKEKSSVLKALTAKAIAEAKLEQLEAMDETVAALSVWVEPASHSASLMVEVERAHGRFGCALAALEKKLAKESDGAALTRAMWTERIELQEKLGWTHWAAASTRALAARFPDEHQPL